MTPHWEEILKERLYLYGHRNWIVIADSAYPAQSRQGIETIVADDDHASVLIRTFDILDRCKHVNAKIYTDQELRFVPESDARGVTSYRAQLERLFKGADVCSMPHEEIISRLDRAGEMFRLLLIKTDMRIPYTSVFFELDCGYWSAQAEDRLRAAMRASSRDAKIAQSVSH